MASALALEVGPDPLFGPTLQPRARQHRIKACLGLPYAYKQGLNLHGLSAMKQTCRHLVDLTHISSPFIATREAMNSLKGQTRQALFFAYLDHQRQFI